MKRICFIVFIFTLSLFANEKVTLQLSWLHQFQFAGYYIAKEKGFYRDAGIDVTINEYEFGLDLSTVLENKKADFAVGRSSLLIDKHNGKDVVAMGAIFQKSPLMLLVTKKSGIEKIEDLNNKRVMITPDAKSTVSILAMLNSKGVSEDDIIIQKHSFNIDDLVTAKTDAMASYVSNEPIRLAERGVEYKIFHPQDYGFHFYGDILFTSSQYIREHPKVTEAFFEATLKGWEYAFNNIVETSEIIFEKYNSQKKEEIELIKEGEALKKLAYDGVDEIGSLDPKKLEKIVDIYKVLGLIREDINLNEFIYEGNPYQRYRIELSNHDIVLISIILFVSLILSFFILFYWMVKKRWLITVKQLQNEVEKKVEELRALKDEQLKQQKLLLTQSKVAAVGEMLGNIAHQWRQPLNIMSLKVTGLITEIGLGHKITEEKIINCADEIVSQSDYLSRTIDDFRDFFKADTQIVTVQNMEGILNKLEALINSSYKGNYIDCSINIEDDVYVNVNENILIQAFINICNNAKDALVESVSDTKLRYCFIDVQKDGKFVRITFRDSGGGIKEDALNQIFEPYFTTKHPSIGTGIGLYMTHQIITKHLKGSIEASNVEYIFEGKQLRGAEFEILLPLIEEKR